MISAGILFVVLIVASTLQVFTRYVLNSSLIGTEELARYCFVWMSLLGGSIAVGRWAHTAITVLYDSLRGNSQKVMFIVLNILIIVLSVVFIKGGTKMMQVASAQSTPTLHIPKKLIYLGVPISGIGMLLHSVEHIVNSVSEIFSGKKGGLQ